MTRPKPQTAHLMASADDVEAQFYEALREGDLERLMALWADDDEVVCIHPGGARLIGPRAIRSAFEAAFGEGGLPVWPERVRRIQTVDAAMHNLVERIEVGSGEGRRVGYVHVTNVYVRTTQGWRIVAHHASPGDADDKAEAPAPPSVLH